VGSPGQLDDSGASRARNGDALFFVPGWDRYGFDRKHDGTHYGELVFLHPMGSVSHVLHSIAFGT
jgi:hypothetical protein